MSTALVLIDLQKDYFEADQLRALRADLLRAANELIDRARREGAPVVEVQTRHAADRSTWALNMLADGEGVVIEGSTGAERLDGLHSADHLVVKTRDSAFHRTDLAGWLTEQRVTHLVLAGVSTESCVAATAVDAYAHDLQVTLVEDATASVEPRLHDQTLDRLRQQYRQRVCRTSQVSFGEDLDA